MSATDSGSRPKPPTNPPASTRVVRRLFLFAAIGPITALAVGVDGGDIFQILAIDNLELDPRALGIALGLGTLSIPVQIWAAGIPLERARTNIRIHLWLLGTMALGLAGLIAFADPGSRVVWLALVIAVMAELSVSVLMATSWQPVVSYTLSTKQRQLLNGQGRAATGIALLSCVVLFGQLGQSGRAAFMVVLGLAALTLGSALHVIPPPREQPVEDLTDDTEPGGGASFSSEAIRNLFIALPATAFASWPLMLSYVALVVWPSVNLGLLGAALSLGGIVASALWRDPGSRLVSVVKIAAATLAACSVAIAMFRPDVSSGTGAWLLAIIVFGTAARSVMMTGIMELAHRRIDDRNAVRVMTMFDVITSTSFQLGFFVAGFLIAASQRSTATLNPFQLWLIGTAVVLLVVISRLRDRTSTTS